MCPPRIDGIAALRTPPLRQITGLVLYTIYHDFLSNNNEYVEQSEHK